MKKTKVGFNIRHITECSHYKSITKYENWASALLQRWRWKYWSFPETVENTLISPWETAATVHLPTATQVPGYFSIRVWVFSPPCVRNPRVTIIRVHLHSMLLPLTANFVTLQFETTVYGRLFFLMATSYLYKDMENCTHIPSKRKSSPPVSSQGQL